MTLGRPTKYSPELAEEICEAIATDSKGLRRLCNENPEWPRKQNILKWLRKYPDFRARYMNAKSDQIETIVDEVLEIADNFENDDAIQVNRSRLRIDTRKWLACKLAPKIYGDKLHSEHAVEPSLMQNLIDKL